MIPASKKIRLILELRQGGILDTALLAAMDHEVLYVRVHARQAYCAHGRCSRAS